MEGYLIYSAILKTKTKVDTHCIGIAASIAAVIFEAGHVRTMSEYANLMFHDPYGGGNRELGVMRESLAKMISERTGKDLEFVLKTMGATTWLNAEEAKEMNFCDAIEKSSEQNRKRATSAPQEPMAMYRVANSILQENIKPKTMNKIANKLGLNDEANQDSIVAAITGIETAKNKAEDALNIAAKNLAEKEAELEKLKNKLDEAEKEAERQKEESEKAEEAKAEEQVKNLLKGFVDSGKIKNEAVSDWTKTAKAIGVEKVKDMLEALPVNKTAARISVTALNDAKLTSVIATTMSEIRAKIKI